MEKQERSESLSLVPGLLKHRKRVIQVDALRLAGALATVRKRTRRAGVELVVEGEYLIVRADAADLNAIAIPYGTKIGV